MASRAALRRLMMDRKGEGSFVGLPWLCAEAEGWQRTGLAERAVSGEPVWLSGGLLLITDLQ